MHFEHVVVINDPTDPRAVPLSIDEVWAGLMWRVEDPCPFQIGLEGCEILERSPGRVLRKLDFGSFTMQDTVHYLLNQWVQFESEAEGERPGGKLKISIESPQAETLILRFAYHTTLDVAPGSEAAAFQDYIRSAYQQADIDTVKLIRRRAAQGQLQ